MRSRDKILVTGGAGFIGSHLVDRLVAEMTGEVVVIDNLRRGKLGNLTRSIGAIRFVEGDIRDRNLLEELLPGTSLVYHLAAEAAVLGAARDPDYSFEANVVGTYELLRAATKHRVRRVVFTSSREVYGEPSELPVSESSLIAPKNAYGASKVAAEAYCCAFAAEGVETFVLRLANVYGPRDFARVIPIFIEKAMAGEPLELYGEEKILDFIWIDIVVEILLRCAFKPALAGVMNLGSGKPTTIQQLAERILRETGSTSRILKKAPRSPEVTRFVADVTRLRSAFGIEPQNDPLSFLSVLAAAARIPCVA